MPFVVTENCIKCKHTDCVEVCPVDCFHEGPNFLVIDPDECIDCTLCEPECPVNAIFPEEDVPAGQEAFVALNAELAKEWPVLTTRKDAPPDAAEMARRIADYGASHAWLVAERGGAILGYAYGSQHRTRAAYATSCDVAIYVDPACARQGVGRALYAALLPALAARGGRRAAAFADASAMASNSPALKLSTLIALKRRVFISVSCSASAALITWAASACAMV